MKKLDNNDIKRLRVSKQTTSRRVYNIPQVTTMRDGQEQWVVTNHGDLRHYKKESGQVWESRYKKYTGYPQSGGWVIGEKEIKTDYVVLSSELSRITVKDDNQKTRVEYGKLGDDGYGLRGFASDGATELLALFGNSNRLGGTNGWLIESGYLTGNGGVIRTASAGQRVEIDSYEIKFYSTSESLPKANIRYYQESGLWVDAGGMNQDIIIRGNIVRQPAAGLRGVYVKDQFIASSASIENSLSADGIIYANNGIDSASDINVNTHAVKYHKTNIYSASTTADILNVRRYATDHTVLNIWSPPQQAWGGARESTLSLVRGDNNEYFVDIYNMDYGASDAGIYLDYGDPQMGIRMQKRSIGVYTPFNIEYSNGTYVQRAMQVLPQSTSATNNDSLIFVNNALSVSNEAKFGSSASYTKFNSIGHQTMHGDARTWRDELGDITRLKYRGTNITASESQNALVFKSTMAAGVDYLYTNIQLNHDRDTSTVIKPHIHWEQTSASQPGFILDYRWQVNGQAKDTSWTGITMANSVYTYSSGTLNQISYSASITPPANSAESDIIQFRVGRDDTVVGDSGTPDVLVTSFDVHIYTNKNGTITEY